MRSLLVVALAAFTVSVAVGSVGFGFLEFPDLTPYNLPQIYAPGYVLNCEAAGRWSGCSGCVHATGDACEWITINEPGLGPRERAISPFGSIFGVCAPKGIHTHTNFVLNYYTRELIGFTLPANSHIDVTSDRCPVDPQKEPPLVGYGLATNDAEIKTKYYEPEYCDFPTDPYPVDRSGFGLILWELQQSGNFNQFGLTTSELRQFTAADVYCDSFNNAENDPSIFGEFFSEATVYFGGGSINFIRDSRFHLKELIEADYITSDVNLEQLKECAKLDQAAGCTVLCPQYAQNYGIYMCQDAWDKILTACGDVLFRGPVNKRYFPLGLEVAFEVGGFRFNPDDRAEIEAQIADFKKKGFEPKCFDPFRIPATSRFTAESNLADPCTQLGKPWVDRCHGRCAVVYADNENCGACGRACDQSQVCLKGQCQPN
jgi:hypothetical protein